MRHVRQQDPNGCLVACLAMVTGNTYEVVRDELAALGLTFGAGGGATEFDLIGYLTDHGFAIGRKYRWHGRNVERTEWPAAPFAPVHIVGVNGAGRHGVVLLGDGRTVLDPEHDQPRDFSEFTE